MQEKLLNNKEIDEITNTIAIELANRNLFALVDMHVFISDNPKTDIGKHCSKLYSLIKTFVADENNFKELTSLAPKPEWLSYALFFGQDKKNLDLDKVAMHISMALVQKKGLRLDDHVEHILDRSLFNELKIEISDDFLVNLSDNRIQMKNHGIIFGGTKLIYPHQFLRRYYSSHFVGMPALLNKALDMEASVSVRLDPLRITDAKNYREIMEFDHWYGPPFSESLLKDSYRNERTLHSSHGVHCMSYDVRHTVFRTKMMDNGLREFMIEEYCPIEAPLGGKSSGMGEKYSIQKFAHFCFDQKKECFTHLDGAVRVFELDEYKKYYHQIASGLDLDEKIGKRHKMFLVEGVFDLSLAQELLTEWFRYNPHIQEYFSGIVTEPLMTYEKLEEVKTT